MEVQSELEPIRLLRQSDMVVIHCMATKAQFCMSASRPVELVPGVDPLTVEPMEASLMTVRQFDEDGVPQTICLTPLAAIQLASAIDSYLYFPLGLPGGIESNDNDSDNETDTVNGRLL